MRIEIGFSEASLFGQTDPEAEKIDAGASAAEYAKQLGNELRAAYPDAKITITCGINDYHRVDGQDDHDECPWVGQIVNNVWTSWAWIVHK